MATSKRKQALTAGETAIPADLVLREIYLMRGHKVMLSTHLAELYEVEPRVLVQSVKRNLERFPKDFMFQLTKREFEILKSQTVISSSAWGGARRAMPYAFTEQGVAMLSSVLGSQRAIQVNIAIMRAFVKLRETMTAHTELAQRIEALERMYGQHDDDIQAVFDAIRSLLENPADSAKRQIGFPIEPTSSN